MHVARQNNLSNIRTRGQTRHRRHRDRKRLPAVRCYLIDRARRKYILVLNNTGAVQTISTKINQLHLQIRRGVSPPYRQVERTHTRRIQLRSRLDTSHRHVFVLED